MFIPDNTPLRLAGLDLWITESASGAPMVISPFDPDTDRTLHEDEEFGLYLN